MKILHINTSDTAGGAALAAMRLHKSMLNAGIDSTFFCLNRNINDDERILTVNKATRIHYRIVNFIFQRFFRKTFLSSKKGLFSNMKYGYKFGKYISLNDYDVIYIHWVNDGFLSFEGLEEICKTGKKIFWFMHDMFPITGGCHYSFECSLYEEDCGKKNCPYIKSIYNFANWQLKTKRKLLDKYNNLSFVAPSKWLYDCTRVSSIAKEHNVYYIPNLLDSNVFRPLDKDFSREVLNLPKDKKIILFGADSAFKNPYKGFEYLVSSLNILYNEEDLNREDIELVIFGSSYNKQIEKMLPFKTHFMGYLHDSYTISLLYNSANVFCIPSLAENYANTILESLHCHTPVVGFNVGGIPDLVCDETGYLAKYKDSKDFEKGICFILKNEKVFSFKILDGLKEKNILNKHEKMWK